MRIRHIPLRLTTGALILDSGLNKRHVTPEAAQAMQGMAGHAFPVVNSMSPQSFGSNLAKAEIGIGAALLAPFVPPAVAGAALTAFGGGLMAMYWNLPGMRQEGSIKPTQEGLSLAKDVWLVGAGLTLMLDGLRRK